MSKKFVEKFIAKDGKFPNLSCTRGSAATQRANYVRRCDFVNVHYIERSGYLFTNTHKVNVKNICNKIIVRYSWNNFLSSLRRLLSKRNVWLSQKFVEKVGNLFERNSKFIVMWMNISMRCIAMKENDIENILNEIIFFLQNPG